MSNPKIIRFEPKGPAGVGLEKIVELKPEILESGSPLERAHNYYTSPSGVLTAGVWECTPHQTILYPYPVDEFMLVLEGSVNIVHADGHEETFRAGDAFVIPKGLPCAWKQTENIRKYYVILDDPALPVPERPAAERAIRLERGGPQGAGLAPLTLPDSSIFEGEPPVQHDHTYFANAEGTLTAGVWTCTPMRRKALPFPRTELMCLLEGSVTLTDEAGEAHAFRAPDAMLVTYGVVNAWTSREDVRKYYCIYQEAQGED